MLTTHCLFLAKRFGVEQKEESGPRAEPTQVQFTESNKWLYVDAAYKPLVPSVITSCSPLSTTVRLPIATLSCMALL